MTKKTHRIQRYSYSFDTRTNASNTLQLFGSPGKLVDIIFVDDSAPVNNPIITNLNSAVAFYKRSTLPNLVAILRNTPSLGVTIDDQGLVSIQPALGLADSLVVCASCSSELVDAKKRGILAAMQLLVEFCGADAIADICPVTFHLQSDTICGDFKAGTTGFFRLDDFGLGHCCIFDAEKPNRRIPFDVANAPTIEDQLLPIHEAVHAWFVGRQETYRIQEPFCKYMSFLLSQAPDGPDYCKSFFQSLPDNAEESLMKFLCNLGITTQHIAEIMKRTALSADSRGTLLSDAEFAQIVSAVMGQDTVPAFKSAGILP